MFNNGVGEGLKFFDSNDHQQTMEWLNLKSPPFPVMPGADPVNMANPNYCSSFTGEVLPWSIPREQRCSMKPGLASTLSEFRGRPPLHHGAFGGTYTNDYSPSSMSYTYQRERITMEYCSGGALYNRGTGRDRSYFSRFSGDSLLQQQPPPDAISPRHYHDDSRFQQTVPNDWYAVISPDSAASAQSTFPTTFDDGRNFSFDAQQQHLQQQSTHTNYSPSDVSFHQNVAADSVSYQLQPGRYPAAEMQATSVQDHSQMVTVIEPVDFPESASLHMSSSFTPVQSFEQNYASSSLTNMPDILQNTDEVSTAAYTDVSINFPAEVPRTPASDSANVDETVTICLDADQPVAPKDGDDDCILIDSDSENESVSAPLSASECAAVATRGVALHDNKLSAMWQQRKKRVERADVTNRSGSEQTRVVTSKPTLTAVDYIRKEGSSLQFSGEARASAAAAAAAAVADGNVYSSITCRQSVVVEIDSVIEGSSRVQKFPGLQTDAQWPSLSSLNSSTSFLDRIEELVAISADFSGRPLPSQRQHVFHRSSGEWSVRDTGRYPQSALEQCKQNPGRTAIGGATTNRQANAAAGDMFSPFNVSLLSHPAATHVIDCREAIDRVFGMMRNLSTRVKNINDIKSAILQRSSLTAISKDYVNAASTLAYELLKLKLHWRKMGEKSLVTELVFIEEALLAEMKNLQACVSELNTTCSRLDNSSYSISTRNAAVGSWSYQEFKRKSGLAGNLPPSRAPTTILDIFPNRHVTHRAAQLMPAVDKSWHSSRSSSSVAVEQSHVTKPSAMWVRLASGDIVNLFPGGRQEQPPQQQSLQQQPLQQQPHYVGPGQLSVAHYMKQMRPKVIDLTLDDSDDDDPGTVTCEMIFSRVRRRTAEKFSSTQRWPIRGRKPPLADGSCCQLNWQHARYFRGKKLVACSLPFYREFALQLLKKYRITDHGIRRVIPEVFATVNQDVKMARRTSLSPPKHVDMGPAVVTPADTVLSVVTASSSDDISDRNCDFIDGVGTPAACANVGKSSLIKPISICARNLSTEDIEKMQHALKVIGNAYRAGSNSENENFSNNEMENRSLPDGADSTVQYNDDDVFIIAKPENDICARDVTVTQPDLRTLSDELFDLADSRNQNVPSQNESETDQEVGVQRDGCSQASLDTAEGTSCLSPPAKITLRLKLPQTTTRATDSSIEYSCSRERGEPCAAADAASGTSGHADCNGCCVVHCMKAVDLESFQSCDSQEPDTKQMHGMLENELADCISAAASDNTSDTEPICNYNDHSCNKLDEEENELITPNATNEESVNGRECKMTSEENSDVISNDSDEVCLQSTANQFAFQQLVVRSDGKLKLSISRTTTSSTDGNAVENCCVFAVPSSTRREVDCCSDEFDDGLIAESTTPCSGLIATNHDDVYVQPQDLQSVHIVNKESDRTVDYVPRLRCPDASIELAGDENSKTDDDDDDDDMATEPKKSRRSEKKCRRFEPSSVDKDRICTRNAAKNCARTVSKDCEMESGKTAEFLSHSMSRDSSNEHAGDENGKTADNETKESTESKKCETKWRSDESPSVYPDRVLTRRAGRLARTVFSPSLNSTRALWRRRAREFTADVTENYCEQVSASKVSNTTDSSLRTRRGNTAAPSPLPLPAEIVSASQVPVGLSHELLMSSTDCENASTVGCNERRSHSPQTSLCRDSSNEHIDLEDGKRVKCATKRLARGKKCNRKSSVKTTVDFADGVNSCTAAVNRLAAEAAVNALFLDDHRRAVERVDCPEVHRDTPPPRRVSSRSESRRLAGSENHLMCDNSAMKANRSASSDSSVDNTRADLIESTKPFGGVSSFCCVDEHETSNCVASAVASPVSNDGRKLDESCFDFGDSLRIANRLDVRLDKDTCQKNEDRSSPTNQVIERVSVDSPAAAAIKPPISTLKFIFPRTSLEQADNFQRKRSPVAKQTRRREPAKKAKIQPIKIAKYRQSIFYCVKGEELERKPVIQTTITSWLIGASLNKSKPSTSASSTAPDGQGERDDQSR